MKNHTVVVPWPTGIQAHHACLIVKVALRFRSQTRLRAGPQVVSANSVLSVVLLCAAKGTGLEIEADGDDEDDALQALVGLFETVESVIAGPSVDPEAAIESPPPQGS